MYSAVINVQLKLELLLQQFYVLDFPKCFHFTYSVLFPQTYNNPFHTMNTNFGSENIISIPLEETDILPL